MICVEQGNIGLKIRSHLFQPQLFTSWWPSYIILNEFKITVGKQPPPVTHFCLQLWPSPVFPHLPLQLLPTGTHGIGILKEPTHPFTLLKNAANHPCFLTIVPQNCLSLAVTSVHATPPLSKEQESDCLCLLMSKLSCNLRKMEFHKERAQSSTDWTSDRVQSELHSLCSSFV